MTTRVSAFVKSALLTVALLSAVPAGLSQAEARAGGGSSFGSRGGRTFSAPPATMTAPRPAQPMFRTDTPSPGGFASGAGMAQPRRFGFGSGLAAGLLGAGLFGMLTGNGFFGGIGGLASMFGFLFQIALIGGLIWLALGFFRNRMAGPAVARGPAGYGGLPGGAPLGGSGQAGFGRTTPLEIGPRDFTAFEGALVDIQTAYGREDINALSRLTTSEMLRNLGGEIEANRRRNMRNDVSDPRLLQGDLSEAWREGATDYASVAMRFSARDVMVDRASGQVVDGNPAQASVATEVWTFRRDNGGPWLLSAIQQAN